MGHFDILHCSRGRQGPPGLLPWHELPWLLVLGVGNGRYEEEQALHLKLKVEAFAESVDQEVSQEHLEACQGLQSGRRRQLQGKSQEDYEESRAIKY